MSWAKFSIKCGPCGRVEERDISDAIPTCDPLKWTTTADFYHALWAEQVKAGSGWRLVEVCQGGLEAARTFVCPGCHAKVEQAVVGARLAALGVA